jgi:hypothetical protein
MLTAAAGIACAANLAAGPMAGHRDARSTVIWLQADGSGDGAPRVLAGR